MFGLFPNALLTIHRGQDNYRLLSPRLWSRVMGQSLTGDGFMNGFLVGDDFRCFGATAAVATNVGRYGGDACQYRSYEDTGDAIAQVPTNFQGEVKFTTAGTDNNESWLQPGGVGSVSCKIDTTAGQDHPLIFEARFKVGQVSNTYNAFIGLSEESLAAADTITDAGALASKDFIGFQIAEGDGDALLFVYRKAGQTAQTVLTYGSALAADTWYNVGFVYDPSEVASKRIKVFVNNAEQSTFVTATNIAAATFPNGEELQPLFGIKNGEGVAKTLSLDGWALWQGA